MGETGKLYRITSEKEVRYLKEVRYFLDLRNYFTSLRERKDEMGSIVGGIRSLNGVSSCEVENDYFLIIKIAALFQGEEVISEIKKLLQSMAYIDC